MPLRPTCFKQVMGPMVTLEYPVAASVAFKALSGRFVKLDTNNRIDIAGATDTAILGWTDSIGSDYTSSSTAGQDNIVVNIALDAIYEMPLDAARTEAQLKALVGETCDIIVTSSIQYADYDASSIDILEIVGYRYYGSASGLQTLLVRIYEPNRTAKGGVA